LHVSNSLRKSNFVVALDFGILIDALIEFIKVDKEEGIMMLGFDNSYFCTNSFALLILSEMQFDTQIHSLGCVAYALKLIIGYDTLLSIQVFHGAAVDMLFQFIQTISS
jgi:hypothetical protein